MLQPDMEQRRSVENLAWMRFLVLEPDVPAWVMISSTCEVTPVDKSIWKIDTFIFRKRPLQPGESWELDNGFYRLLKIDPETGEKRVTISDDQPAEKEAIFSARVNLSTDDVTFENVANFRKWIPEDYQLTTDPITAEQTLRDLFEFRSGMENSRAPEVRPGESPAVSE